MQRRVVPLMVRAACAAAALALLPAASASAAPSEAFYSGGNLNVGPASFGDSQRHEITVRYDAGTYRVSDTAGSSSDSAAHRSIRPTPSVRTRGMASSHSAPPVTTI